ncbi:MAG: 2-C-methyl-D-erythritol 4-phosphate cytidylyltransferase [Oscillospiraceae bacterium]|nr:2-C-methyl-D-erythritol 4-phosphate cytidylyltransferase [Oscillospiraceae bacterium]
MSIRNLHDLLQPSISCSVVIVAAGSSQRFGSDKLAAKLANVPVLSYSLTTFECCKYVSEIIVVTDVEKITEVAELCERYNISKMSKVVCGGASRLESALSGVSETDKHCNLIAIHDGARPLVSAKLIEDTIEAAHKYKAAIPAVPSRDTIKIVSNSYISETPYRSSVFCAQTPQVFVPELIKGALTNALENELEVFDDASAVENLGFYVYVTEGSEENIKITTPLDMKVAECILASRRERSSL